jgi:Uma2 family endonuclease
LFDFCQAHDKLRIEQTADGELIIMAPTGGATGHTNAKLIRLLGDWADEDGTGICFNSNTAFILPNGAERSPDASWLASSRWARLSTQEQERFPPLGPDFVAEIRSRTDSLPELQAKMAEFVANGARLGWLLDPKSRHVWVYEPKKAPKHLVNPSTLSGGRVLKSFQLNLAKVW